MKNRKEPQLCFSEYRLLEGRSKVNDVVEIILKYGTTSLFNMTDKKIESEQEKLEFLKEQKKGFMQQMFI